MDVYFKVTAGILVATILCVVLSKQGADISILMTITVCCMVITAAFSYISPVLDFLKKLSEVGRLDDTLLNVLMKATGIGLISQIAGFVCSDAGNQSLAKALQIMTTAVIFYISLPVLEEMLSLIELVLGKT